MRVTRPFKRKDRKAYYCKIDGKQIKLSRDKKESYEMFAELIGQDSDDLDSDENSPGIKISKPLLSGKDVIGG